MILSAVRYQTNVRIEMRTAALYIKANGMFHRHRRGANQRRIGFNGARMNDGNISECFVSIHSVKLLSLHSQIDVLYLEKKSAY
jgi:hypothetical protein